jgi:hypothetical protein
LAMYANNRYASQDGCDLAIKPDLKKNNRMNLSRNAILRYYQMGRQVAEENLPKIKELIREKTVF